MICFIPLLPLLAGAGGGALVTSAVIDDNKRDKKLRKVKKLRKRIEELERRT